MNFLKKFVKTTFLADFESQKSVNKRTNVILRNILENMATKEEIKTVENKMDKMEIKIEKMEIKIENIENKMENKFTTFENKQEITDNKINSITINMEKLLTTLVTKAEFDIQSFKINNFLKEASSSFESFNKSWLKYHFKSQNIDIKFDNNIQQLNGKEVELDILSTEQGVYGEATLQIKKKVFIA